MKNSNQIETFLDVESEVKDVPKILLWFRHLRAKIPRVGRQFVIIHIIMSIMIYDNHSHHVQLYSYAKDCPAI